MNFIIPSFLYVVADTFFWPSMGMTVTIGIFIGSVLYDGILSDVKKMMISLVCYAVLIAAVNLSRVIPQLSIMDGSKAYQPFASIMTLLLVSIFYAIGAFMGVWITKKAHPKVV
jgi:hypothetical protein